MGRFTSDGRVRRLLVGAAGLALVVGGLALAPHVVGAAYRNAGMLALLKASVCDPAQALCRPDERPYPPLAWAGNRAELEWAGAMLEEALRWAPPAASARLHLAAIWFALERREAAAALLGPQADDEPWRSPLLQAERYEQRLLEGVRLAGAGRWPEAIQALRLGLAWGGEWTTAEDDRCFFLAVAAHHAEGAAARPGDRHAAYLAGKYFARAERWDEAARWLDEAIAAPGGPPLGEGELGLALVARARTFERQGHPLAARQALEAAVDAAAEPRLAYFHLLERERAAGAASAARDVESRLEALGPAYQLGVQWGDERRPKPATLPGGATLVGYDLDEETLETGGPLELLLWWQGPAERFAERQRWLAVGRYWLERQTVVNLFPNAGFEWGTREDGLPLGHAREYYGQAAGRLRVARADRDGADTAVLLAANDAGHPRMALTGPTLAVDPDGSYLMAGWVRDEGDSANIGRNCWGGRPRGGRPHYVATQGGRPADTWVHVAELATPTPGDALPWCETLLINHQSEQPARWDNILWARLERP